MSTNRDPFPTLVPPPKVLVCHDTDPGFTLSDEVDILITPASLEPVVAPSPPPSSSVPSMTSLVEEIRASGCVPEIRSSRPRSCQARARGITVELVSRPTPQSYRVVVEEHGVYITGSDPSAVWYGVQTFIQCLRALRLARSPDETTVIVPAFVCEDAPDLLQRGVMLDVSRDRVPLLSELFRLVEILSSLKYNELQFYTEHTFAYRGAAETVWKNASPITPDEMKRLNTFCRDRFVQLIPNQQSLGHMNRWLEHDEFRPLADHPEHSSPYSLCPTDPRVFEFLSDLYGQLLPLFPETTQFNVGMDEVVFEHGRSGHAVRIKSSGRVYLEYLQRIRALAAEHGKQIQFWGDVILHHHNLIAEIPKDVVALLWNYEQDFDFDRHAQLFQRTGLRFYVCPGTSSWNSLSGRTENALENISRGVSSGVRYGACGMLLTDWGDRGHLQPPPVSYVGYVAGAAFSWNVDVACNRDAWHVTKWLDAHVFQDSAGTMGRVAYDLGCASKETGVIIPNESALIHTLMYGHVPDPKGVTLDAFQRTIDYIRSVTSRLDQARMHRPDAALIEKEFRWVADVLVWACRIGIAVRSYGTAVRVSEYPLEERQWLAVDMDVLIERYRVLWNERSRPGGFSDSVARLGQSRRLLNVLF